MLNKADKEVFDVTMAEVKRGYNVSGSTNELLDEHILWQVEYKLEELDEMVTMTRETHIKRHVELLQCLDELVADWLTHTSCLPSRNSVMDLMRWASKQTINPTE